MKEAVVLREREKELACIYSICLLAAGAPEPGSAAEGIARALCAAMSAEPMAACSIRLEKGEERVELRRGGRGSPTEAGRPRMAAALRAEDSGGWKGEIAVEYLDPSLAFLPQERALLDSVLVVTASMLRTASLIAELRAISEDLRSKNTALREILSMIEEERSRMLEAFRERLSAEILPLAERSRDPNLSPERREAYAGLLAEELKRGISSLGPGPDEAPALSPREREVAIQVRNGRTSKEIAELLGIAEATVERHRHNIRRKLRIAGQAINLTTLLGSSEARGSKKFKDSL